ncbi:MULTISPECIES: beta-ketoacyl synthase N-terminal-like domain-containing protein [unclassified Streptomyces]|uniref:beta-ketoacyl synthase N-terminal-like domain-containing protein n=2 Tax=unclassified Streptomyces TaxID=2593676 RepID=UPI0024084E64|nr:MULTISPECIES: beta-ketoacyl synthase N-terminal-like domain-containing protein [unclassified Streptomyces]
MNRNEKLSDKETVTDRGASPAAPATPRPPEPIAIVGMSALHPRAHGIEELWRLLTADAAPPSGAGTDAGSAPAPASLGDIEVDVARFGIPPAQAASMARLQLLMVEAARQCLDDASGPGGLPARTDVVVGTCLGLDRQYANALRIDGARYARDLAEVLADGSWRDDGVDPKQAERELNDVLTRRLGASPHDRVGEMASTIPARIASAFKLRGRTLAVESADATSYVALAHAVDSLRAGLTDAALVVVGQRDEGRFARRALAAKGFAAGPDGTGDAPVLAEGLGALLLKRRSTARRDGDRVYASVLDCALRHEGRPGTFRHSLSAAYRRAVAEAAHRTAGVAPGSVGLVEGAGPGTDALGRAEQEALAALHAGAPRDSVALGSVQDRLGHTFANAGLAGVTKAALALHHRTVPPARTGATAEPFRAPRTAEPWEPPADGTPRRAAVLGASLTGTVCHVLLEEHTPATTGAPEPTTGSPDDVTTGPGNGVLGDPEAGVPVGPEAGASVGSQAGALVGPADGVVAGSQAGASVGAGDGVLGGPEAGASAGSQAGASVGSGDGVPAGSKAAVPDGPVGVRPVDEGAAVACGGVDASACGGVGLSGGGGGGFQGRGRAVAAVRGGVGAPVLRDGAGAAVTGDGEPVAVVGFGGRFADSPDADGFWRTMLSGRDRIGPLPAESFDRDLYHAPGALARGRSYTDLGAPVPAPDAPPAGLRIPPHRYAAMDAAQRLALDVATEMFARHGRPPHSLKGVGTVAVGSNLGLSRERRLHTGLCLDDLEADVRSLAALGRLGPDEVEALTKLVRDRFADPGPVDLPTTFDGSVASGIAALVANEHRLDAVPVAVEAACASSLAALDVAVGRLRSGAADYAVAGGVELPCNARDMVLCSALGLLSHSRITPFDAAADGFTPGDGCALFLLKRLADARRDGDPVFGVLRAVGASNDTKSLIAPDADGQARAVRQAFAQVDFGPDDVDYLEAHGTGTRLGDRVEVAAVAQVYGTGRRGAPLHIGSAKSFLGHTFAAAGAAGLLRTLQAMRQATLPPSVNLSELSPDLALDAVPARVATEALPWPAGPDRPRRAAVSAFGTGGINYHLLIEEGTDATR